MARTVKTLREGPVRSRASAKGVTLEQDMTYHVYVDSATEDRIDILTNTAGLPVAGLSSNAFGLKCQSVDLNVHPANGKLFVVTARFASDVNETEDPVSSGVTADPTSWVPQAELEFEPYEEVMQKDLDNKPALNGAGDPLDHGITVVRHIATRTFTQYENCDVYSTPWADDYYYTVGRCVEDAGNKYVCITAGVSTSSPNTIDNTATAGDVITDTGGPAPFLAWRMLPAAAANAVSIDQLEERCHTTNLTEFVGRAAGTLLLDIRKATIGTYYGQRLWKIEYSMKWKPDGWTDKRLNMGYRYIDESDADKIAAGGKFFFTDKMTGAHFLGKLNADGTAVADQINDDPSILEFRNIESKEFSDFLRIV